MQDHGNSFCETSFLWKLLHVLPHLLFCFQLLALVHANSEAFIVDTVQRRQTAQVAWHLCKDDRHRIEKYTTAIQAHDLFEKGVTGVSDSERVQIAHKFKMV